MTDLEQKVALATDFPPATREEWRKLVDAALKGAPFERLASTTYDGIAIAPLAARRPDARPVAARAGGAAWQVVARIDQPDPALANELARHEVENGATALTLVFAGAVGDHGFALPARAEVLGRVLEGIASERTVAVELDLSARAEAAIDAALAREPTLAAQVRLRLGHDPLGAAALAGGAPRPWRETAPHFARRLAALARDGFDRHIAAADGRIIHNAGGSEAQELAFGLSVALAYLRALEAEGVTLDEARKMLFFRLTADTDQLLTIAKFRALRKLWARVEAACGLSPAPAFVSAETAWRMMTRRDPQVNMLRSTIATFAAALGGADAIGALPFDAARGLPGDLARRIARNMQLILLEESHLAKVADPAAGAGAVEAATDQLCQAAWAQFKEIEAAGGAATALEGGLIQQKVAAVRAQRMAALAHGKDALTGINIFPNLQEAPVALPGTSAVETTSPLRPIRLAEPYEALRDASDRRRADTGARPRIFLACLGAEADFTPQATFAKNFFEAGGIEAVSGEANAARLAAAFKTSGAALACICGAEHSYESGAPAAAATLKAAGCRHVYLAAAPDERGRAYRDAGIETFIYSGCNALAVLQAAHRLVA
jgi:methylmalonyl-CoA mutase